MCVTSITLFMQTSAKNAYVTSTIAKSTELPYWLHNQVIKIKGLIKIRAKYLFLLRLVNVIILGMEWREHLGGGVFLLVRKPLSFWRRGLSRHSLFLSTFLRSVRTKNTIFQNYYKFKAIRRPTGVCHAAKVVPCSFNLFTTFVFLINPVH